MADTLAGDGPFTVFAPTDQAFTDAGINLDDFDTEEENNTLSDILLYHVISGAAVDAANVTDGMTAEAANGDTLSFTVTNDSVIVGDATVTSADVEASNGIIHVIDKVLMPPADVVEEPVTVACDVTVGVVDTAYDRPSVSIDVGQTVCWEWTEADMPHNVAEIEDISSTEILAGGIYSGEAKGTVFFSYTFTENTTFYYACEPHLMMNMKGEVIVGTGIDANDIKADDSDKSTESTPGFLLATSIIAMAGAVLVLSRRS
ncbi:MAG: fasciclin domain-containing protein [Candidatus Poseidoniaceae archaeon]|nr:fasciclin domain-containing protein [Candidatus Poseidoniaceae archaeon]